MFKLNFGLKKKNGLVMPSERDTSSRDWKIVIACFTIVMVLEGWLFWTLFQKMSDTKIEGSSFQMPSFSRDNLNQTVDFYKDQADKYQTAKSGASDISDPSK